VDIALKDRLLEAGYTEEKSELVSKMLQRACVYAVLLSHWDSPPVGVCVYFDKHQSKAAVDRINQLLTLNPGLYARRRRELIAGGAFSNAEDHKLIERYSLTVGRTRIHPVNMNAYRVSYAMVYLNEGENQGAVDAERTEEQHPVRV